MQLKDILLAYDAFGELATAHKVNVIVAFKIAGIINNLKSHVNSFNDIRDKLLFEHGTLKNGSYIVDPGTEAFDLVNNQLNTLAGENVNGNFGTIKVTQLTTIDGKMIDVKPELLVRLYQFLETADE